MTVESSARVGGPFTAQAPSSQRQLPASLVSSQPVGVVSSQRQQAGPCQLQQRYRAAASEGQQGAAASAYSEEVAVPVAEEEDGSFQQVASRRQKSGAHLTADTRLQFWYRGDLIATCSVAISWYSHAAVRVCRSPFYQIIQTRDLLLNFFFQLKFESCVSQRLDNLLCAKYARGHLSSGKHLLNKTLRHTSNH